MAGSIEILTGPGVMALVGAGGPLLLDRKTIGETIEFLVALLDVSEPDPEAEETGAEDSFCIHPDDGPGCPIAETDHCKADDDSLCWIGSDGLPGGPENAEDNHDREAVEEGI
jgi:hypothetical protein